MGSGTGQLLNHSPVMGLGQVGSHGLGCLYSSDHCLALVGPQLRGTSRAAAIPPCVPCVLHSRGWGHQEGDFSPYQHFPVSDSWTARPSKEICLICCICNQGFDCLDFWVNTTAYAPLFGHSYFTCMALANIDPCIWLQCRTIRNQAESSFFSLDLLYSFLLTHLPLLDSSHSLSSNHIWSLFFQYSFLFDFLLQKHVYPDIVDNYHSFSSLSTDFSVSELVNHIKNSGFIAVVSRTPDREIMMIPEEITPL